MYFISYALLLLLAVQLGAPLSDPDFMVFYWRRSNSEKCKPFTPFDIDCNTCVCGADGVSYCTRLKCPKSDTNKHQYNHVEDGDKIDAAAIIGKEDILNYRSRPRVL